MSVHLFAYPNKLSLQLSWTENCVGVTPHHKVIATLDRFQCLLMMAKSVVKYRRRKIKKIVGKGQLQTAEK